jgi:ureidoglycolate hydrolase
MYNTYLKIKTISKTSFKKYGTILEHTKKKSGYEPLVKVKSNGWIWAALTIKKKYIDFIECHTNSRESFEPAFGTTIIVLAQSKTPHKPEAFLLDNPILLNERVWHNVLSLSETSQVKITENTDVKGRRIEFKKRFSSVLTFK